MTMSAAPPKRSDDTPGATCAHCGAPLVCEPAGDCWCKHETVRLPVPIASEGCLCVDCLRAAAAASA